MKRYRILAMAIAGLSAAVWAYACGDGATEPTPTPDPARPTTVTVTPASTELTAIGATVQLAAQVLDQNGQAMTGAAVTWSSSATSVATVGAAGLVTAAGNGTATITATSGSASGTAGIVVTQEVGTVTVTPAADTLLALGDTLRLAAEASDANGHVVQGTAFTWESADTLVAVVDSTGLVTGIEPGDVAVTATAAGVGGHADLTVVAPVPTTVAVTPDTVAFTAIGQNVQLVAEVLDQALRVMENVGVTWSSTDTAIAVVDSVGLVTAAGAGSTTVAATTGDVSGVVVVTVMQSAGSVVVSPAAGTVAFGDTLRLAAEAFDENGHRVQGAEFGWASSDTMVATVDASGLVTGVAEGKAEITAATGEASGTSEITVENPDRAALVALYNATGGPNWVNSENWLTDAPLEDWYGVGTVGEGRVYTLSLQGNHLAGSIPAQIGRLAEISNLDLGSNDLSGVIPREIGQLTNLWGLSLQYNRLEGTIPQELGSLVKLRGLSLYDNALSGPVPAELGGLSNLRDLYLGVNALDGALPAAFQDLTLESFFFARNAGLCAPGTATFAAWLDGIPRQDYGPFCNESDVAALESLYEAAGGTNWANSAGWGTSGVLDEWYGIRTDSLGRVTALDLSRNRIAGRLPSGLGQLDRMKELRISGNPDLSGRIPFSLLRVRLDAFHYDDTDLCVPPEQTFHAWLNGIQSHDGTDVQCTPLSDRDILVALFDATNGNSWIHADGWLTHAALGDWHGVRTDPSGRVTALDLAENELSGSVPPELGSLDYLTTLRLGSNELSGPIPSELGALGNLEWLSLVYNDLTGPIPSELGSLRNLTHLQLWENKLSGPIPPELGTLGNLERLSLAYNDLTGPIPSELGSLRNLTHLQLWENKLSGSIPGELGNLRNLEQLDLSANDLTGAIPLGLGDLGDLTNLHLGGNELSGPIPPELGTLGNLERLSLAYNDLTGPIPSELGSLRNLAHLHLYDNKLSGSIPRELGDLGNLTSLRLSRNQLSGPVSLDFSNLRMLRELSLAGNAELAGPLPIGLTSLGRLEVLLAGGTGLCALSDAVFQEWLRRVSEQRVAICDTGTAYLTQAVQSREFPVPLMADEDALLRVFVTATDSGAALVPPVRSRFYLSGEEVHVVHTAQGSCAIPTEVDEGDLCYSANAEVPAEIVRPGLEMVIEIDPEGTLEAGLVVARRIPESGRMPVDVRTMPRFNLTLVPFLWSEAPDSTILAITEAMAANPGGHENLRHTRTILPVGERLGVKTHPPVLTTSNNAWELIGETRAVRALEGGSGYWMGTMSGELSSRVALAYLGGWTTFVPMRDGVSSSSTIAHELGHNMSLAHAPCGGPQGLDPFYPHRDGRIGAWGFDRRGGGRLISPDHPDVMSYCRSHQWIGDYNFTKALLYRLIHERSSEAAGAPTRSLMLWGGVDPEGAPYLEPAFVVDAPPVLPQTGGEYGMTGMDLDGSELFSLRFDMPETVDGEGYSSFAFVLPVRHGWERNIATITLTGPGGSFTLDGDSDAPMTILRDPRTGRIRGFLREERLAASAATAGAAAGAAATGLEVLFSRGIPSAEAWRQ